MNFRSDNVLALVRLALLEDMPQGDITSDLSVPADAQAVGKIVARESMTVCGLPLIEEILIEAETKLGCELLFTEGAQAKDHDVLAELRGNAREILMVERTILNFLQRLCGVSTYTKKIVAGLTTLKVLDTRKTMPGWRALDKYAVLVGGGSNHRANLSEMVLVKNNHIDAHPGGISGALKEVFNNCPKDIAIEVEVRDMQEIEAAAPFGPKIIMLDNFSDGQIPQAIAKIRSINPNILVEVSGGVSSDRLKGLESMGVNFVSIGALTTKANNVDISMRIKSNV